MPEARRTNDHGPWHIRQGQLDALLQFLPSLTSGSLTMSLNKLPFLRIDSDSRSLSVEAAGVRESGLKLAEATLSENGAKTSFHNLLTSSEKLAKTLSRIGWTLTLYDGNSSLLSLGRGVSRLTGHVRANPLKLRRLIRALRESGAETN